MRGFDKHVEAILEAMGLPYDEDPKKGVDDGYVINAITALPEFPSIVKELAKDRLIYFGYHVPRNFSIPYGDGPAMTQLKKMLAFCSVTETQQDLLAMVHRHYDALEAHQEPNVRSILLHLRESSMLGFSEAGHPDSLTNNMDVIRETDLKLAQCEVAAHRFAARCGLKLRPESRVGTENMRLSQMRARAESLLTEMGMDGPAFMQQGLEPRDVLNRIEHVVRHTLDTLGYKGESIQFRYRDPLFMELMHNMLARQTPSLGESRMLKQPGENALATLEATLRQTQEDFTQIVEDVKKGAEIVSTGGFTARRYEIVRDVLVEANKIATTQRIKKRDYSLVPLLETKVREAETKGLIPPYENGHRR